MIRYWLAPVLCFLLFVSCATSPTGRSQLLLVSPEEAILEARTAYAEALDYYTGNEELASDAELAYRIGEITGRLVSVAVEIWPNTAGWNWSVMLIDDPENPNAWCMAGGLMAIYTGLVYGLDLNDDEIAQIMGHEIGHAIANHTAEHMSIIGLQEVASAVVASEFEDPDLVDLTDTLSQLGLGLPNSRTQEYESDEIGMELAVLAGYAPEAGESVWNKLMNFSDIETIEFFSTHPSDENRRNRLIEMASRYEGQDLRDFPEPYPVTMHWSFPTVELLQ